MSFSPRGVKATIDGVVRAPSRLAMTRGFPPSITAMQQFVVPRSMPMTLPISGLPSIARLRVVVADAHAHHRRPEQAIVQEVAALEHLGDRMRRLRRIGVG